MKNIETFFECLEDFAHREIFHEAEYPWTPLKTLEKSIAGILSRAKERGECTDTQWATTSVFRARGGRVKERCLIVRQWFETPAPIYMEELGIFIGAGAILEPTAIIKGPAVIGDYCEIRQGAYLRGNTLVGNHCVIGHNTEIKNSILMNHTEAGHFNYIGDSILGSYVNLGAGSRLANLQFRTSREKREAFIRPIKIDLDGQSIDTGMEKLGAVLGDYVELGCNAVASPGVLLGKNNWVYPNATLPKGFYKPNTFIGPRDRKIKSIDKLE